jgi:ATP-binding cassette subfamily B protein
MLKLIKLLAPDRKKILFAALLMLVYALASLALPTIMSMIVDNGINAMDKSYIIKASVVMLAIALGGLAAQIVAAKLSAEIATRFSASVRSAVFNKVMSLPYKRINEIGTSALLTRSTEDVWILENISYMIIRSLFVIPVFIIGGTVLALVRDIWLALIMFSGAPVLIGIFLLLSKKISPLWEIADLYIDKQNAIIKERFSGIRVIRAFNREARERERTAKATKTMAVNIIRNNVTMNSIDPIAMLLLNLSTVAVVYLGARLMQDPAKLLSAGDVIAVIQYITLVMNGMMAISFAIAFLPRAKVNCKRINEVLDSEGTPEPHDLSEPPFEGNISFENVGFSYPGAQVPALAGITLDIRKGEKIAFIGGTGSGKSTVVQLLMGFSAPTSGIIRFDGIDTKSVSAERLRQNIGCVLQKSVLFEGTIKSNIALARPGATDEEIAEAATDAGLAEFLANGEKGIEHEVKPYGTNLSGGQKQRVAIARALLRNTPIYIFDDSFSALDFLTEAKIRKTLAGKLSDRTQIIVTQRITSAMNADKIFVLDNGRLIGSGKHAELLESCGVYREIYLSQTGGGLK